MSIKLCLIVSIDVIHKTGKDTSTSAHLLIQLPDSNLELKFKDTVRHTGTESGAIEGGGASTSLQEAERWKTLLLLWKDYSIDYGKGFSVAFSLTFFFFVKLSISIIRRTHTLCLSLSLCHCLSHFLCLSIPCAHFLCHSVAGCICLSFTINFLFSIHLSLFIFLPLLNCLLLLAFLSSLSLLVCLTLFVSLSVNVSLSLCHSL